jgi:pantoate kinase
VVEVAVPISISGIWYPVISKNPEESGSIGLTLVLEPYIISEIKKSNTAVIYFNGRKIDLPNLTILKAKLGNFEMNVISQVPLGYGYGVSGALSLAYVLGAKEYLNIKEEDAVKIAHISEVITGNGLGDVISQYYGGGLVYRKKPGAPRIGEIEIIKLDWEDIYSKPLETMPTQILIKTPNPKALEYIEEFLKEKTLKKFFEISKKFTESLGFKSPYINSFRKKGVIVKLGAPVSEIWIKHKPALRGAYII